MAITNALSTMKPETYKTHNCPHHNRPCPHHNRPYPHHNRPCMILCIKNHQVSAESQ